MVLLHYCLPGLECHYQIPKESASINIIQDSILFSRKTCLRSELQADKCCRPLCLVTLKGANEIKSNTMIKKSATCCWSRNALDKKISDVCMSQSTSKFPNGTCSYIIIFRANETDSKLNSLYIIRKLIQQLYMGITWKCNSLIQPLGWCSTSLYSNFCSNDLPANCLYKQRTQQHVRQYLNPQTKSVKSRDYLSPDIGYHEHWKG